ncbi:MAG TPA: hypothetical protein VF699_03755 [Caulobacteraceae bacterium]|jgi:predicted nuclease with TOPRIM domain
MDQRREENRRRLAELAAENRRARAAAEPEIARKEAALAKARADLARLDEENALLEGELDSLRADSADDDAPGTGTT